jgi:hypothetical protein
MASETETLALHLVSALNDAPDGRPMQWRMIEHLDGVTADVVEFAAARGWVQVEGSHIALTEAGRQLAKGRRRGGPDENCFTEAPKKPTKPAKN